MIGQDGWIRDSFIIDKKPTQLEIIRIKGLFRQIEEVLMKIENLGKKLLISESNFPIRRQIHDEREHLLFLHESLTNMWRSNECLWLLFIFEGTRINEWTARILEELF